MLTQASNAVVQNKAATAKEEVGMAWSSCEADYWANFAKDTGISRSSYFTMENLNGYLEDKGEVTELDYQEGGTSTLTYVSKDDNISYKMTIDSAGTVTIVESISSTNEDNTGYANYAYVVYSGQNITLDDEIIGNILVEDGSQLTISGGRYTGTLETQGDGEICIYGGTFTIEPNAEFIADGYVVSLNGDGEYVVSSFQLGI